LSIKAPYLPYEQLRHCADQFLNQYHSSRSIPVPIESIVEFQLGIDIVPMPGLHQGFDIDSMISSDLTEIRIDQYVFESRPGRYRFSLAHELGHLILHKDIFAQMSFSNIQSWKIAVSGIPLREYGWLEFQAYSFAGLILVPSAELNDAFRTAVEQAHANGIDLDAESEVVHNVVAAYLARDFVVSPEVVNKRMEYDELWKSL